MTKIWPKSSKKFEIFAKIWPKNNENFEILAKFGQKSIGKLWSKRYVTLAFGPPAVTKDNVWLGPPLITYS